MAEKCKRNYVYLAGDEKGGAGILDRGRAVGAAQKEPWDELFYRNLTLQLSNYCYVCVAGLTEEEKQGVFACCCLLYQKNAGDYEAKHAPFAVRTAHRALMTSEYGLWKLQGKWFPLIA